METIYYHLDARRVSAGEKASGESVSPCKSYAVLRKVAEKRTQGPKVLDFEAYRRRSEQCAPAVPAEPAAQVRPSLSFLPLLELLSALAVLATAAIVILAFLPFL